MLKSILLSTALLSTAAYAEEAPREIAAPDTAASAFSEADSRTILGTRAENLFEEQYITIYRRGRLGRSIYAGIRGRF